MNGRVGIGLAATAVAAALAAPGVARAQAAPGDRNQAAVVVDGVVREVFQSARQNQTDYLVQIEATGVNLGAGPRPPRALIPAPGDTVYVHVADTGGGRRFGGGGAATAVPPERASLRAYLAARPQGGWQAAGASWFDRTNDALVAAGPNDPPPAVAANAPPATPAPMPAPAPLPAPAGRSPLDALGIAAEPLDVNGRFVLRVTDTVRNGPAERAGLQPGDILVAANGAPLTGMDQVAAIVAKGGEVQLAVIDVNTGKGAQVSVALPPSLVAAAPGRNPAPAPVPTPSPSPSPAPAPTPAAGRRSLGISAEAVTVGQRTAMRVVEVDPDSPAGKAGLEKGDVIVAANGAPVTGVEGLAAALRKSGPRLELLVRDTRTGRDTPVTVNLGGPEAPASPVPLPTPTPGARGELGIVTELAFFDAEAAVKVTEVAPGSPAAAAGIEVGDIITEANGKPVLHPNELTEAVRASGATLTLTVVDPRRRQATPVKVDLGR
jgi:S1-C subfamily serine protease